MIISSQSELTWQTVPTSQYKRQHIRYGRIDAPKTAAGSLALALTPLPMLVLVPVSLSLDVDNAVLHSFVGCHTHSHTIHSFYTYSSGSLIAGALRLHSNVAI